MDNSNKLIILSPEEEMELDEGRALYEMTQTRGFQILKRWFEDRAIHTWVDPREVEGPESEKEWKWRELNAFFAASNAREVLEDIQKAINKAEYLEKKRNGEMPVRAMKV